ncbi:MAG: hypothetical protein U5K43_05740 [Halofilum sp. (in: g-proteobacteria)]|nr:hypothetical protein [Halofilum sp. (in: g-proteobacteria)]
MSAVAALVVTAGQVPAVIGVPASRAYHDTRPSMWRGRTGRSVRTGQIERPGRSLASPCSATRSSQAVSWNAV